MVSDQKRQHIAEHLMSEVVPLLGVPEALLSYWSPNLLSHLMYDVCSLLDTTKHKISAHYAQYESMGKHFTQWNRALKSMEYAMNWEFCPRKMKSCGYNSTCS